MKVLMCKPDYYEVSYEINPWMDVHVQPDRKRANKEWQVLYDTYRKLGVDIELIQQVKGLPDMVFTANAGLLRDKIFVSGNFRFKERKNEETFFQKWFKGRGFTVKTLKHFQGGEGDALFYKDTLYMGYGFRSDPLAHKEVADILLDVPFVSLHLVDPYFYDFDTVFCPVGERGFLYYPPALDKGSRQILQQTDGAIEMTKTHAEHFIGNSVYVEGKLLVSFLDEDLKKKLKKLDVEPIFLDMSEFKKAGGGIKCLTLYIDQE